MIRRVAFRKAILAGVLGALAWEAVMRGLILMGLPLGDLVRLLGTLAAPHASPWIWYPIGLGVHAGVGAIWAIFYAYFFWSTLPWPPPLQGLAFSLLPAVLAGLVMMPQLGWMHPLVLDGVWPHPGVFAAATGRGGPASLIIGHLIYGLVIGGLYTRPVGYATRRAAYSG